MQVKYEQASLVTFPLCHVLAVNVPSKNTTTSSSCLVHFKTTRNLLVSLYDGRCFSTRQKTFVFYLHEGVRFIIRVEQESSHTRQFDHFLNANFASAYKHCKRRAALSYWNRTRRHDLANLRRRWYVDTSVYITHVRHNPKLSLFQQLVLFAVHSSLYWRRNCNQKKDNKDIQKEERLNFRKILSP